MRREVYNRLDTRLRPQLDFHGELNAFERNLTEAQTNFAQNRISFTEKMQANARAMAGVQYLAERLRADDLLPPAIALSEAERAGKQRLLDLATVKHDRLQTAHLLETDEARRFAYEKMIEELDAQIAALKTELNA
ncbi:MAG: hypothetical protein ABMA02_13965 [Saprospiraceae bacterium]